MWTYEQATGRLLHAGALVAIGYAGRGAGVDNAADERVVDVGPLPCGLYTIGAPVDGTHLGEGAMPLTPDPDTEMFGRGDFWMHQDNVAHNETGSEGCIVQALATLVAVAAAVATGDDRLEVVSGL
jgi:hypothetical protein